MDAYTKNFIMSSNKFEEERQYWLNKLQGVSLENAFPRDFGQRIDEKTIMESMCFYMPDHVSQKIQSACKNSKLGIFVMLLSGVKYLLYKYTGNKDIILGMPAFQHKSDEERGMSDIIALRTAIDNDFSFKEYLSEVKKTVSEAKKYKNVPLDKIVEILGFNPEGKLHSLLKTFVLMEELHDEVRIKDYEAQMFFVFSEAGNRISVKLMYDSHSYEKYTIEKLKEYYIGFFENVLNNPDIRLSEVMLMNLDEINRLLYDFNSTDAEYPKEKTIHELFENQVEKTPEGIAVKFRNKVITYKELNERSNQLARVLRGSGAGPDKLVAIIAERSIEMMVGILAILKAGGAYLPIEPDYPKERIEFTLLDSGAKILLTQSFLNNEFKFDGETIYIDDESLYCEDGSNLEKTSRPGNIAYVIYTSGTTGMPKGVMIEHRNVVRLLFNDKIQFDFSHNDIWTMFHSFSFDFSVWEMYGALLYGGTLVMVPKDVARSPKEFIELLENEKVTVLNQTPTAFYNLINEDSQSGKRSFGLRYIIFGGEALKPVILKPWKVRYPEIRFINMYGITETTVHVTYKEIGIEDMESALSNIGKPIPTLTAYVMDDNLMLQPFGVMGELCVGGEGVARGYLNRPELTRERFVQNPYKQGELLYRSGDLVRFLKNGDMEYLGRKDHQVKIRGHRIELGEIENILLKIESIKEALVIANDKSGGEKFLTAYLVAKEKINVSEIRESLKQKLPGYMVPAFFVQLDEIPMTSNGKVNRNLLPKPMERLDLGIEYVAPRNETEEKLTGLFQKVLGIDRIGINDNFFDIGGNSILLVKLHSLIEEQFPSAISAADLFSYTSIQKLAEYIENKAANRNIIVKTINIDDENFTDGAYEDDGAIFDFSIDGEILEKIRKTSLAYKVQDVDILLSVLIYVMSGISIDPEITIQTMLEDEDLILPLEINTDEVDDFYSLLSIVNNKRLNCESADKYRVSDLKSISLQRASNAIALFYYRKGLLQSKENATDYYDLIFGIEEKDNDLKISCEFNGKRLRKQKVLSLLDKYLKSLRIVANKQ